uniref:Uncharacterized protein n=1 Tax=Oryza punctata TaxID=4537 RepID=A0A0E0KVD1_ORYPU
MDQAARTKNPTTPRLKQMASRRRDLGRPLLVALCVVALFAVGSESHGLEDFGEGKTEATPAMASFFGNKPEAAELPEALDASNAAAKPEAASAIPTSTRATTTTASSSSAPPRRSVSVAAGVACAIAAVAVVGVAVAVAYVVRARRGARRESEVRLGSP